MKKILLLLILFAYALPGMSQEVETTTYYLIRHAEKDRTDKTARDPHLAAHGKERALRWAEVFKNFKLDAVYSTEYNRTKETGTPTAEAKNLTLQFYHPTKIDMDTFKADTKGKSTLILGHSNTTAGFANKLIGSDFYPDIDDSNNANLYIVSITGDKITHVLVHME